MAWQRTSWRIRHCNCSGTEDEEQAPGPRLRLAMKIHRFFGSEYHPKMIEIWTKQMVIFGNYCIYIYTYTHTPTYIYIYIFIYLFISLSLSLHHPLPEFSLPAIYNYTFIFLGMFSFLNIPCGRKYLNIMWNWTIDFVVNWTFSASF